MKFLLNDVESIIASQYVRDKEYYKMVRSVASATATHRISPARTLKTMEYGAIGIVELNGTAPYFHLVRTMLREFRNIRLLEPFPLGSGTISIVIAGDVAEVRKATSRAWLWGDGGLKQFEEFKPLVGSYHFDEPSLALKSAMRELKEIPATAIPDLMDGHWTLGVVGAKRIEPLLEAMDKMRKEGDVKLVGKINNGSTRVAVCVAAQKLEQVESAVDAAKEHLIRITAKEGGTVKGAFDGACVLTLVNAEEEGEDASLHDMQFALPWKKICEPLARTAAVDSHLEIETQYLGPLYILANEATHEANLTARAPEELGSGTETAILSSSEEDKINEAKKKIEQYCEEHQEVAKHLINLMGRHGPGEVYGANINELKWDEAEFDAIKELMISSEHSVGLIDTVCRWPLYYAMDVLKSYATIKLVGTRKLGSRQAFLAVYGPQGDIEAALEEIKERIETIKAQFNEKWGKEILGDLPFTGIIRNPTEQVLRMLPWKTLSVASKTAYVEKPGDKEELPVPYYKPGDPLAFVETIDLAHAIAISNKIFQNTGIAPVEVRRIGSGHVIIVYAHHDYSVLEEVTRREYLLKACEGAPSLDPKEIWDINRIMPNAQEMIVHAEAFPEPGQLMWDEVEHQKPLVESEVSEIADQAVGFMSVKGVIPAFFIMDELKSYNVELHAVQKSGGKHLTIVFHGNVGDVRQAVAEISRKLEYLIALQNEDERIAGELRTFGAVGRAEKRLVHILPRVKKGEAKRGGV